MKQLFASTLLLLLFACNSQTTNQIVKTTKVKTALPYETSWQQKTINGEKVWCLSYSNLAQKPIYKSSEKVDVLCYSEHIDDKNKKFYLEEICEQLITPKIVEQLHKDLELLDYKIESTEIENNILGKTTKNAIFNFQKVNNLVNGLIDIPTLNIINKQARKMRGN